MFELESIVFERQPTSNHILNRTSDRTSVFKIIIWLLLFALLIVTICVIFLLLQYLKLKNDSDLSDKSGVENIFPTTTVVPFTVTPNTNKPILNTTLNPDWWNPI